jgi:hypothetical protein
MVFALVAPAHRSRRNRDRGGSVPPSASIWNTAIPGALPSKARV